VRTAEAVAASRKETLGYRHLVQVKDVSHAFEVGLVQSPGPSPSAGRVKNGVQG
jgi:hypothetical protein